MKKTLFTILILGVFAATGFAATANETTNSVAVTDNPTMQAPVKKHHMSKEERKKRRAARRERRARKVAEKKGEASVTTPAPETAPAK